METNNIKELVEKFDLLILKRLRFYQLMKSEQSTNLIDIEIIDLKKEIVSYVKSIESPKIKT